MNPILSQTTRSGIVEKASRGAVSVVDAHGKEVLALGDTAALVFPRSALKLVQVLPLLEAGLPAKLGLPAAAIALMCGSHNAEPAHVNLALQILGAAKLGSQDLRCGTHPPLSKAVEYTLVTAGLPPASIHSNCSGKHAGFLAFAKLLGASIHDYTDPDHPVQVRIRAWVSRVFEVPETQLHFGIDGCTAPNYAMPLRNIALGFRNLALWEASVSEVSQMAHAVAQHPWMVAGTDRFCTLLMEAVGNQVLGKLGADGVYCMALRQIKWGVAIKIDDGSTGPQYQVALAILLALGVFPKGLPPSLHAFYQFPNFNCRDEVVGETSLSRDCLNAFAQLPPRSTFLP